MEGVPMRVQVLVSENCPHREPTLRLVYDALHELGIESTIDEVSVGDVDQARRLRFLGSPTVLVDGNDVEPARRTDTNFALCCRIYGSGGTPPRDMVVAAIREARAK
jgi:hypothetical protein